MKPRDTPDPAPVSKNLISSNTQCEFGKYDSEPFPVSGDATYWYARAVYWKRECERNTGVQGTPFCVPEKLIEPHVKPNVKPNEKTKYPMFKIVPTSVFKMVPTSVNDDGSPMTKSDEAGETYVKVYLLDVLDLMQIQSIFALAGDNENPIGAKIAAIKYVRDRTGWGLYDSKSYVDYLVDGKTLKIDFKQVSTLLSAAGLISTIKYVREVTGWGLKEAKDLVNDYVLKTSPLTLKTGSKGETVWL